MPREKPPTRSLSWADAFILGAAVMGMLLGFSLLSPEFAVATGVIMLGLVAFKLLTTKA